MIKLFSTFIHPVPAEYEEWLENLAQKGYHPKKISQWSSTFMKLQKGEPKKYRYVLDMQPFVQEEYFETYKDFGWELCGQMASTYLWRMEYTDERPESFTDYSALKERNKRFLKATSFSFILLLLIFLIIAVYFILNINSFGLQDKIQFSVWLALTGLISAYIGFVMFKINKHSK